MRSTHLIVLKMSLKIMLLSIWNPYQRALNYLIEPGLKKSPLRMSQSSVQTTRSEDRASHLSTGSHCLTVIKGDRCSPKRIGSSFVMPGTLNGFSINEGIYVPDHFPRTKKTWKDQIRQINVCTRRGIWKIINFVCFPLARLSVLITRGIHSVRDITASE